MAIPSLPYTSTSKHFEFTSRSLSLHYLIMPFFLVLAILFLFHYFDALDVLGRLLATVLVSATLVVVSLVMVLARVIRTIPYRIVHVRTSRMRTLS